MTGVRERMMAAAMRYANGEPEPNGAPPRPTQTDTCTDSGNASLLVKEHGHDLRHCHPLGVWFRFCGSHWLTDDTGTVMRWAKAVHRRRLEWATQQLADDGTDDERKPMLRAVAAWCVKSLGARPLKAMIELARCELPILPNEMDRDPWLLNARNTTIDLKTGTELEHRREDFITRACPVEYDPAAQCPTWERCLMRWMNSNPGMIAFLQRAIGYSLTGDVGEQCLFFLHGDGANGKSVFLAGILGMLGDYACQAIAELLMQRHGETHPTERADLHGRRFVATIETEDGRRMAEALVKQLTGGDKIRARRMRQDFWEFSPTHKIWLAANHRPQVRGTDHAIWRRIKVVPFTVTIPPEERDPHLSEKLKAERAGILAWAVRGCLEWQRIGLAEPEEVKAATEAYRAEQDMVGAWLAECCVTGPDYRSKASSLLASIASWAKTAGETSPTQRSLAARLDALGFVKHVSNGVWYVGIAVRPEGLEGSEPSSG